MAFKIYGQYVQFNQPDIDWDLVAKELKRMGYNGFSVHFMSPWGGKFYQWMKVGQRFNLDKDNPVYYDNVRRFARAMFDNGIAVFGCFFDAYFLLKDIYKRHNNRPHPFVANNKGFNWGQNAKPLYESWDKTGGSNPPDEKFAWVIWKTNGKDGFAERVVSYKFNRAGVPIRDYIIKVAEIIDAERCASKIPGKKVFFRAFNENYTRYKENGDHDNFGGESKIYEILQDLIEENTSMKHGKHFQVVDDWVPLVLNPQTKKYVVDSKRLVRAQKYNMSRGWLNEVHNCNVAEVKRLVGAGIRRDRTIFSTDSLKPEKDPFFTNECKALVKLNLPFLDLKVPSELTQYYNLNFMRTFKEGRESMERFLRQ